MILARSIKTANFINLNAQRPFAWGDWDCNLFVADLLDHIDADMPWRSQAIRGKYSSRLGAARFQYNYTPAPTWLEQQGFVLTTKHSRDFREHDIILEPKKRYWTASLYFAGRTWSVVEEQGLAMNTVESGTYMVGEFNG